MVGRNPQGGTVGKERSAGPAGSVTRISGRKSSYWANLEGARPHHVGVATPEDFASFYAATWSRLLRTTYAVTGDAQLAEDAVQTGFAHAYASWARVRDADDPVAYVRRIALNAALGHRRRAFFRREVTTGWLPDRPDAVVCGRDEDVWRLVQALPPRQRAVVVLRYYEDLSEQQIAEAMGCRPGTVKSQASAALANLRSALSEQAPEGDRA